MKHIQHLIEFIGDSEVLKAVTLGFGFALISLVAFLRGRFDGWLFRRSDNYDAIGMQGVNQVGVKVFLTLALTAFCYAIIVAVFF